MQLPPRYNITQVGDLIIHNGRNAVVSESTKTYCIFTYEDDSEGTDIWKNIQLQSVDFQIGDWVGKKQTKLTGKIVTIGEVSVVCKNTLDQEFIIQKDKMYKLAGPEQVWQAR